MSNYKIGRSSWAEKILDILKSNKNGITLIELKSSLAEKYAIKPDELSRVKERINASVYTLIYKNRIYIEDTGYRKLIKLKT